MKLLEVIQLFSVLCLYIPYNKCTHTFIHVYRNEILKRFYLEAEWSKYRWILNKLSTRRFVVKIKFSHRKFTYTMNECSNVWCIVFCGTCVIAVCKWVSCKLSIYFILPYFSYLAWWINAPVALYCNEKYGCYSIASHSSLHRWLFKCFHSPTHKFWRIMFDDEKYCYQSCTSRIIDCDRWTFWQSPATDVLHVNIRIDITCKYNTYIFM